MTPAMPAIGETVTVEWEDGYRTTGEVISLDGRHQNYSIRGGGGRITVHPLPGVRDAGHELDGKDCIVLTGDHDGDDCGTIRMSDRGLEVRTTQGTSLALDPREVGDDNIIRIVSSAPDHELHEMLEAAQDADPRYGPRPDPLR